MKRGAKTLALSAADRLFATAWFVALQRLLRRFRIVPPRAVRWWVRFRGEIELTDIGERPLRLHSSGSFLEGELFWYGYSSGWEKQSRDLWMRLSAEAHTILDIGANTGIYALLATAANPAATVVAFEPQPNIYEALQRNVLLNGFTITCEQLALSDTVGLLPFYDHGFAAFKTNTTSGSLNRAWRPDHQQSIEVDVTTLQQYALDHPIETIDLIKIDVETLEPAVLRGAGDLLTVHLPAILLEVSSPELGAEVAAALPAGAYVGYAIDETGGLTLDDALGAASDDSNRNYLLCPGRFHATIEDLIRK